MASSISSGSGQASPARRARCRQSMTVVAPIDRLAAILRLDMPAAVSRSTSRTLRMGNLAPGIGPFPPVEKGPTSLGFADHPTAPFTLLPRNSQPLLGIVRNGCSGSVGTTARDQSVRVLGINWNSCSGSLGAPNLRPYSSARAQFRATALGASLSISSRAFFPLPLLEVVWVLLRNKAVGAGAQPQRL